MDLDNICKQIIANSQFNLTTYIKSELEKIKLRDLKELGGDCHYNYAINTVDISMDATDPLLSGKPADMNIIFRMVTPRYISQIIRKKPVNRRVSQSIWYITDRGLIIERHTSFVDDAVFLQYIRHSHSINREQGKKSFNIKSYKVAGTTLWQDLASINNSLPILPIHFYNIFANNVLSDLCSVFNQFNIGISIDTIAIYLAEIARNAAKSPHIDELLVAKKTEKDNESMLKLIADKDKELELKRAKIDAEYQQLNLLKKRILDEIDDIDDILSKKSKNN